MNTTQRVNAAGTKRRLQSLFADGMTGQEIARLTGLCHDSPRQILHYRAVVNRKTAIAVYGVWRERCRAWSDMMWDDDTLDAAVAISTGPPSVGPGRRLAVDVVEDLDDLAEQMGFVRDRSKAGWPPRARRHVAARLGMSMVSFDRAVYRGRDYQRQNERNAA